MSRDTLKSPFSTAVRRELCFRAQVEERCAARFLRSEGTHFPEVAERLDAAASSMGLPMRAVRRVAKGGAQ